MLILQNQLLNSVPDKEPGKQNACPVVCSKSTYETGLLVFVRFCDFLKGDCYCCIRCEDHCSNILEFGYFLSFMLSFCKFFSANQNKKSRGF